MTSHCTPYILARQYSPVLTVLREKTLAVIHPFFKIEWFHQHYPSLLSNRTTLSVILIPSFQWNDPTYIIGLILFVGWPYQKYSSFLPKMMALLERSILSSQQDGPTDHYPSYLLSKNYSKTILTNITNLCPLRIPSSTIHLSLSVGWAYQHCCYMAWYDPAYIIPLTPPPPQYSPPEQKVNELL